MFEVGHEDFLGCLNITDFPFVDCLTFDSMLQTYVWAIRFSELPGGEGNGYNGVKGVWWGEPARQL
jgi:hypothetical protein